MLVQIVLFDGFDLLDAIGPYEVFQAAGINGGGALQVELVSVDGARAVPSGMGGPEIRTTGRPDLARADILLVPGASGTVDGEGSDSVAALLAREAAGELPRIATAALAEPDMIVATVCGGSLILAMAGVLKGRPAVTHHMGMAVLETTGAKPIKARVVDDGNLVSGGGVTSGIDVAMHLVERKLGPRVAHAVETLFEYERRGTVWRDQGLDPSSQQPAVPTAGAMLNPPANAASTVIADVKGRWDVVIATPMGKQVVIYEITDTGGLLTGTATQGADVTPLLDLAVDHALLTWSQHVTKPMRLHLRFEVLVDGNAMTGTAKAGFLPASKLTGVRQRGPASPAVQ